MKVIIVPAPEPKHSGHKIRVVESRPPSWYMEKCYSTKGRKTFKRHRFIDALKNISKGTGFDSEYGKLAVTVCEHALTDPEDFYGSN